MYKVNKYESFLYVDNDYHLQAKHFMLYLYMAFKLSRQILINRRDN